MLANLFLNDITEEGSKRCAGTRQDAGKEAEDRAAGNRSRAILQVLACRQDAADFGSWTRA